MATQLHTEIIPEIARTAPRPAAKIKAKKNLFAVPIAIFLRPSVADFNSLSSS